MVIAIIGILSGMALGALAKAREAGKLAATKATVAKLNDLVMKRYETYRTRRIPWNLALVGEGNWAQYALFRTVAIRALMLMEMPQCWDEIKHPPVFAIGGQDLMQPSLSVMYLAKYNLITQYNPSTNTYKNPPAPDHQQAKCLYLWVMTAMPEAKALFRPEEINMSIDGDNWPVFVDGWGHPIGFLRWAPGASSWSDIQIADLVNHHDPFDPMLTENGSGSFAAKPPAQGGLSWPNPAYQLYPLIFAGVLGKVTGKNSTTFDDYGIVLGNGTTTGDPRDVNVPAATTTFDPLRLDPYSPPYYATPPLPPGPALGAVMQSSGNYPAGGVPLVTNHHLEQK